MPEIRTIVFDAIEHKYADEYRIPYTSTTQCIGKYESEFDVEYWTMYRALDKDGYRPRPIQVGKDDGVIEILFAGKRQEFSLQSLYAGVVHLTTDPLSIMAEWGLIKDEACIWGSNKHSYLEDCILAFSNTASVGFNDIIGERQKPKFANFDAGFVIHNQSELDISPLKHTYPSIYHYFVKVLNAGWTIYVEVRLYTAEYRIAGTADILLVKGKEFFVLDWKTNKKEMKFEAGYYKKEWLPDRSRKVETDQWVPTNDRFKAPLSHLPYAKGVGYTLQLSTYAFMVEQWGLKCVGLMLCHIKPVVLKDGTIVKDENGMRVEEPPRWYQLNYLKQDVELMLSHHLNTYAR